MELRKIASKKPLKFLTLLLTAMLIGTASAAIYYSLSMTSTITTAANDVYFVKGPDNGTAGVNIFNDNKSASLTLLKAYPNMTTSYDDPIRVRNNGSVHNIRLRSVSLSGNATYFVFINFTLQTSTKVSLNYTSNGASWTTPSTTNFVQADAGQEYAIVVQTMANATATSGQTATIEIAVDIEQ